LSAALEDPDPAELPQEVADAYAVLDREAALGAEDPSGDPGADREPFDPDRIMRDARDEVSFGRFALRSLLAHPRERYRSPGTDPDRRARHPPAADHRLGASSTSARNRATNRRAAGKASTAPP